MLISMGKQKWSSLIAVFTIIFASCTSDLRTKLYKAENMCPFAPDSSLAILNDVRLAVLTKEEYRQLYDIVWAETYYIDHREITDSIEDVLSRTKTIPGTNQHLIKQILHSIYLYGKGRIEESFSNFELCSRELDKDIHPYWKAVVEDYMGLIYLSSGLATQSRNHFYKVLEYAQEMQDDGTKINAYSHISCYHLGMGQLDSALYYASKVLYDYERLDSQMVAIAYNNLASIQIAISETQYSGNMDLLQISRRYGIMTEDSIVTYALMTQAYYLQGKLDSAYYFQSEVEHSQHNMSKYVLYRFLSDYYHRIGNTDSAYKYVRRYYQIDSLCMRNPPIEALLNTAHAHRQDEVEKESATQKLWICLIFVICFFVFVLFLVLLYRRYRKSMLDAHHKLQSQESNIKDISRQRNDLLEDLDDASAALSQAESKIQNYRAWIERKNSELATVNRINERQSRSIKAQGQVVIKDFLDKSVSCDSRMNKVQMENVIESYVSCSKAGKAFVHFLSQYAKGLTPTGILICILYRENFTDNEIITKLHCNPQSFRMAKSRARASIDNEGNNDSILIKELLRKFDYKK